MDVSSSSRALTHSTPSSVLDDFALLVIDIITAKLPLWSDASRIAGCLNVWVLLSESCGKKGGSLQRVESFALLSYNAAYEALHSSPLSTSSLALLQGVGGGGEGWSSVPCIVRDLLGGSAAILSVCALSHGNFRKALRDIDTALLLLPPNAAVEDGVFQMIIKKARQGQEESSISSISTVPFFVDSVTVENIASLAETTMCSVHTTTKLQRRNATLLNMNDYQLIFSGNIPTLISHSVDHWPALTSGGDGKNVVRDRRWCNLNYIASMLKGRGAPIEEGGHYASPNWCEKWENDLSQFVTQNLSTGSTGGVGSDGGGGGGGGDAPLRYLAQARLFDLIPELQNDAPVPDSVFIEATRNASEIRQLAWLGPCGTFSPLHTDVPHNYFVQVVGVKRVRLFPPGIISDAVIPRALPPLDTNTSSLPEIALHALLPVSPEIMKASIELLESWKSNNSASASSLPPPELAWAALYPKYAQGTIEPLDFILRPGDALFIPSGWWHSMSALSVSFSVSFWWEKKT